VKAVPLQTWSGPEGSRKLRLPDLVTTAQDGGKVVSLTHRPPLTPEILLVLISVRGWVDLRAIVRSEEFYVNEKSTDTSWDRTSDLTLLGKTPFKILNWSTCNYMGVSRCFRYFRKIWEKRLLTSLLSVRLSACLAFCLSVRPSVCLPACPSGRNNSAQTGRSSLNLILWHISKICPENSCFILIWQE